MPGQDYFPELTILRAMNSLGFPGLRGLVVGTRRVSCSRDRYLSIPRPYTLFPTPLVQA